jgi:hypothetical protein
VFSCSVSSGQVEELVSGGSKQGHLQIDITWAVKELNKQI